MILNRVPRGSLFDKNVCEKKKGYLDDCSLASSKILA